MNEPLQHDDFYETAPESGTARRREGPERAVVEDFESEHERRFFCEPPVWPQEHIPPCVEPVVAESESGSSDDGEWLAPSAEERAWFERVRARRAALGRWVVLAISTEALVLLIAGVDHQRSAQHETARQVPGALPWSTDIVPVRTSTGARPRR